MGKAKPTVRVGDDDDHEVGNAECGACWSSFPRGCEEAECPGLVHAAFGDENSDCDYWLYYRCDVCGVDLLDEISADLPARMLTEYDEALYRLRVRIAALLPPWVPETRTPT